MIPLNIQPAEKQDLRSDGTLDVMGVWLTIQGEGPFAGRVAVFIRLAGCDLRCPSCDTDYTSDRQRMSATEIMSRVLLAEPEDAGWAEDYAPLLVLTGGEPFRQALGPLIREAIEDGYDVQVETNGTLYDPSCWNLYGLMDVVCSPKTPTLSLDLLPFISAYKYILSADEVDPQDGLPLSSLGMNGRPARPHEGFQGEVFVQPLDEQDITRNALHAKACVESCLKYGYRLSMQTHKGLGLK